MTSQIITVNIYNPLEKFALSSKLIYSTFKNENLIRNRNFGIFMV